MRHTYAVMAVLCLFVAGGCADIKNDKAKTPNAVSSVSEHIESRSISDLMSIQVQPTTKAERYIVYFSWPKIEDDKRIRIRKEQVLALVPSTQTTFSHEVDHDQTITYTFEVLNSSSTVEKTFAKLVKIPRDFVVRTGQSEFNEDQKINIKRLFLNTDISLKTNGHNIQIMTEELISNKGLIETFTEGAKADASSSGKGAGELILKAKSAIGQLKIVMRGQNGGDGFKGQSYTSRAADGAPPTEGAVDCVCPRCPLSEIRKLIQAYEIQPMACFCETTGSNGGNGAGGAKGYQGGPAGNGGDSGKLYVEINDGSAFLLQTDFKVGAPGLPGEGGDGQPGGIAQGHKTKCSGNIGSNGPTGPKGDAGPAGSYGEKGIICVYIATEGKNDCF
ncbi:MAG: hypothetical protein BroJett040_08060 [Oligoflexia bacterium]|nr:MAG: hypothetical protein BroJett040_08060 [Oligoflexia bacterium]